MAGGVVLAGRFGGGGRALHIYLLTPYGWWLRVRTGEPGRAAATATEGGSGVEARSVGFGWTRRLKNLARSASLGSSRVKRAVQRVRWRR